jgi:hypothetical protein
MLTADIKINGKQIGYLTAVHEHGEPDGLCQYRFEYYQPDYSGQEKIVRGTVRHLRTEGALVLMAKVARAAQREAKKREGV